MPASRPLPNVGVILCVQRELICSVFTQMSTGNGVASPLLLLLSVV